MEERAKILIVDDERFNINVLSELLKPDYKIMAAINGQQALKAARSASPPDLILLDIMMPEMDGYEVCRQLKADAATRDIPVIFVTAMGQESDEEKGLEVGAVDYLRKPISPPIVEARVRTHVALRKSMLQLQQAFALIEKQKERMEEELNVGRDIQMSMLPLDFPAFPDHDEFFIHATMQAAREVGGDFYDFGLPDKDHLYVCVGDVSGKGVPAALFMAITKALIKSRASNDLSTASILTHVNEEIEANNEACMFVTVFLGIINIRTGEMVYTSAGHNPPYIRRHDGSLQRLDQMHGPVIGAAEGIAYREDRTTLGKNDFLLLYTDGVTEAMDPDYQLFEEHRLIRLLETVHFDTPKSLVEETVASVKAFENGAEQADDITVLALQFCNQPPAVEAVVHKMAIKNRLSEIDRVNSEFEVFVEQQGIPQSATRQLKLAFDELLNNTISYGYKDDEEHEIDIRVEVLDQRLLVTIVDDGVPFNPFTREAPDISLDIDEREIGGLGIHLCQQIMDEASYKRGIDKNQVTLIKYLDKQRLPI